MSRGRGRSGSTPVAIFLILATAWGGAACGAGGTSKSAPDARPTPDAHATDAPREDAGHARDAGRREEAGHPHDARVAHDAPLRGDAHEAGPIDAPTATTLAVSPLTLTPAFDVGTHDYYVRCAAGTNEVTVTMTAAPGETVGLLEPKVTHAGVAETEALGLREGQALVVGVTGASADGGVDEYWVRCLPHDFPLLHMTAHPEAGVPSPGYYLFGDVVQAAGEGGYAMAIDQNGVPVWYEPTDNGLGAAVVDSLVPGTIAFIASQDLTYATDSGQFELEALDAATTSLQTVGAPVDLHEMRLLANGDYLVFADPIIRGVDLTGLSTFGPQEDMVGCLIQELTPAGKLVWQWDITDHFDAVKDSTWPQVDPVDGKTVVDPFHCNSIDVDANGDLLVSARHMDSVFLVSRQTGKVMWKMGGTAYSKDGAPFIAVTGDPMVSFHRQHDVRMLADGYITMFDDQTDTKGPDRAVVYSYSVDAGTASIVWSYKGTATSLAMGSFRIEPDGARVIGWGVGWGVLGNDNRAFTELDESGNDLLDFGFPDGDDAYRAIKVPLTQLDLGLMRRATGRD